MAAGVGSKVESLDYNQIQTILNNVFGAGSGDYGYGQTVSSNPVAQHTIVTVAQWNSLRNDLLKARQHQSGVDESGNLGLPTLDIKLTEADRAAYLSMANLISNNRTITPPSGEASFVTLITSNRSSGWTGTVDQTIIIEFGTANNLRWFFNAGGNFQLSASLTNYATTGDSKLVNESWEVLLKNMGIIKLTNSSTSNTGTGSPAVNTGFSNLTSTNQLIFSKLVEAGNQYTPNRYDLYARISGGSALVFTPTWSYTDAGNDGTYRVFEPVTGTLNSFCQMYIATGANVAVTYPQIQFTGSAWTYSSAYATPPPSYSIRPNSTLVNEGSTITYTVSTANIINGTVLYWKNIGSSTAQDFVDGANSGTVTITADSGIITRAVGADTATDGSETVVLQLLTGSLTGVLVAVADTVTISDTSLTPISYTITPNTPSQDEGLPVIFTVTTTGVVDGTLVYWINVGTTGATDFPNSINNGSFPINGGTASLTRSATADFTTEGSETIIIELHTGSLNGPLMATSSAVTVVDVSTTPIVPTYDVAPSIYSVNEGSSLIFYVTTSSMPNGTTLYWTIDTNASDFSVSSGATVINSNAGQFSVTPSSDSTTEGPESFSVSIRTVSTSGQVVATSPTITIGDASTTPPPYVAPPEPDPAPTVTMGNITPIGGYGIGQPYSINYSTSYANAVSGTVTGRGSTSLGTSGTYAWTNAGYGVQTVTISASGPGGTTAVNSNYTVYQPSWSISPQFPTVNQTFRIVITGGLPNGTYSFTGFDGSSGSSTLNSSGGITATFSGGLTQVQTIYYDIALPGTGSALYDAAGRTYAVIHPNEVVTSNTFGGNWTANTAFNVTISQGAPNITYNYSITVNSGGPSPYPPSTSTFDSSGNFTYVGLVLPAGNYTFIFTFPSFSGGAYGTTIGQRTRTATFNIT